MREKVFQLLLIIDERIVNDDGYPINSKFTLSCRNRIQVKFFRIEIRDYDVINKGLKLLGW